MSEGPIRKARNGDPVVGRRVDSPHHFETGVWERMGTTVASHVTLRAVLFVGLLPIPPDHFVCVEALSDGGEYIGDCLDRTGIGIVEWE